MKVVIGIDSGANGRARMFCIPIRRLCAPIGSITELRDILETAKKYAETKSHSLDCFVEEVTGYIGGKPQPAKPLFRLGQVIRLNSRIACRLGNSIPHCSTAEMADWAFWSSRD